MIWLLAVILVFLAIGVAFLIRGRRGHAIDDHPICRKCGFDLFGLDGPARCPECGVELSPGVICIGHRQSARLPLAVGFCLTVTCAVALIMLSILIARRTDWQVYKPVWWLLRDNDVPALTELNCRQAAGSLSSADINRVVATGLAVQADVKKPFLIGWGEFIENVYVDGKLDAELWKRYAKQSVPLSLVARPNVRRGDVVPIGIRYGPMRLAGNNLLLRFDFGIVSATLGGVPLAGGAGYNAGARHNDSGEDMNRLLRGTAADVARLPDGLNVLQVKVATKLLKENSGLNGKELWSDSVTLTTTVNLVPENQSTVEVVADPALRKAVEASLVLHGYVQSFVSFGNGGTGRFVHITNERAEFLIGTRGSPVALAYAVAARPSLSRVAALLDYHFSRATPVGWVLSGEWAGFDADKVDVILRANPAVAAETVDIDRIWNGEITFKDVEVKWEKDAKRPTSRSVR